MTRNGMIAGAVALSMTIAAPAFAQSAGEMLKGTAIGGAGGAVAGAVLPGLSTGDGALIGAAGGAAVTALSKNGKKYHRDSRGRKYYINKRGERVYKR